MTRVGGWQIDDEARLSTLRDCGVLGDPDHEPFDDVTQSAASLCAAPISIINFLEADRQHFKSRFGTDLAEPAIEHSLCAHVLLAAEAVVIADLSDDERTRGLPLVVSDPGLRFYAASPIVVDGQALGTLCVLDWAARPGGLTPAQAAGLDRLGAKVASLITARAPHGTVGREAAN